AARDAAQLSRELPHESEPEDDNPLPDPDVRDANCLHGDRADRGECGEVEGNAVRHPDAEVPRHEDHLGMTRVLGAATRDTVAHRQIVDVLPDLHHLACAAVSERGRRLDAAANGPVRLDYAVPLHLAKDPTDEVRALADRL